MKAVRVGKVIDTKIVNNIEYKLVVCGENGTKIKMWIPEYSHLTAKSNRTLNKPVLDEEEKISRLYQRLQKASESELLVVQNKVVRLDLHELPPSKKEEIRADISALLQTYKVRRRICPVGARKLRQRILYEEMVQKRDRQLSVLFCLEKEINLASKSTKYIRIENVVDLEVLPFNFSYVNKNVAGEGVAYPNNPPIGCDCRGERICILNNCCPEMFSRRSTYNERGLVVVPARTAIYECNRNCKCLKLCPNRTVQRGSDIEFVISRAENRRWTVRTLESISKGSFVVEYVGEVITRENAIKRSSCANVRHHLFDLDFNTEGGECRYAIDSTFYGNLSRFLNQCDEPNLEAYSVWIDWSDPDIYHLAFFASRDILRAMKFNARSLSYRNMCGNALSMNVLRASPSICGNTTLRPLAVNLIQMRHRHVMDDAMEPHRTFRHDKKTGVKTSSEIVLKKFFRLRWGAWIRAVQNKDCDDMWKKNPIQRRHYEQHVFCTAKQCTLFDKMVTDEYKEPHYYVDDPYEPYHTKEEFAHTRAKPLPPSSNVYQYLDD